MSKTITKNELKKKYPKYYGKYSHQLLLMLKNGNSKKAFGYLKQYYEKYPNDLIMSLTYANLLIKLKILDEAKEIISRVELISNIDPKVQELLNKLTLKILVSEGKYYDAYLLLTTFNVNDYLIEYYYLLKECNLKFHLSNNVYNTFYVIRQLLNYDYDEALERIKLHQNIENIPRFRSDLDVEKILEVVKNYIPNSSCYAGSIYSDSYCFRYDKCGYVDNQVTDYFVIITFHNTEDIITMYPISKEKIFEYVDINSCFYEEVKTNTKRLSEIEKFNKKYNINNK